jgi:DNA-binding XRE family transcriptional regulator
MNEIRIKELREKLGVSQEKLAEMLGVHENARI